LPPPGPKYWPCLRNISAYRLGTKRSVMWPSKIRQNAFPAGAPPRTSIGRSRRSPKLLNRLGMGHDSPAFGARHSVTSAPRFGGGMSPTQIFSSTTARDGTPPFTNTLLLGAANLKPAPGAKYAGYTGVRCKLSVQCPTLRGGSLRQHGLLVYHMQLRQLTQIRCS